MATRNSKRPSKMDREVRASERDGISLDWSAAEFRDMMTEQSRSSARKWTTYYAGTRAEFIATGVPDELFPCDEPVSYFNINGQPALLRRKGIGFELELTWPEDNPWYHSAGHPAIAETERMLR